MLKYFTIIIFIVLSCAIEKYEAPLYCTQDLPNSLKKISLGRYNKSLDIPSDWIISEPMNQKDTKSFVCLDTVSLYSAGVTNSITISILSIQIERIDEYIALEKKIAREKYNLIRAGKQRINNFEAYWMMLEDEELRNIIYYIFDENILLVNFSTSRFDDYEIRFCKMLSLLKTLKY